MKYFDPLEMLTHMPEAEVQQYLSARGPEVRLQPGELNSSPGFWYDRRVLVTGLSDFLGELVVERLHALGCRNVLVPRSADFDLTRHGDVERLYRLAKPDLVLHLAEQVGGIGANRINAGEFYYSNAIMGLLMIEEARKAGVQKFVQIGTITSYPRYTAVPFREEDFWNGYPDPTNAAFGIAKKMALVQLQAYREQYGFCGIYLIPANLYGPRDSFDPERSYVIPALIRKMVEARESGVGKVEVWGSGEATREFLYVDDCARAILLAAEHYEGSEPVNLGTGDEIKIKDLASLIAKLTKYEGTIEFDRGRPEGQPRRRMSTVRAQQLFGFLAHTTLQEGLRETIGWYAEHSPAGAGAATQDLLIRSSF